jgi:hypothetical protein
MYVNPMQQFLERKTGASNRFNSEVCMYVNPMQQFLERKQELVIDLIPKYVCKSHAGIP